MLYTEDSSMEDFSAWRVTADRLIILDMASGLHHKGRADWKSPEVAWQNGKWRVVCDGLRPSKKSD